MNVLVVSRGFFFSLVSYGSVQWVVCVFLMFLLLLQLSLEYTLLTFCFSSSSSSSDFETELMYIPMNDSDTHSGRTERDKCYSRYRASSKY